MLAIPCHLIHCRTNVIRSLVSICIGVTRMAEKRPARLYGISLCATPSHHMLATPHRGQRHDRMEWELIVWAIHLINAICAIILGVGLLSGRLKWHTDDQ